MARVHTLPPVARPVRLLGLLCSHFGLYDKLRNTRDKVNDTRGTSKDADDPALVKAENTVTVSFPDGKPGAIGAVVIRAGLEKRQ